MISPRYRSANARLRALLPEAVGPSTARTSGRTSESNHDERKIRRRTCQRSRCGTVAGRVGLNQTAAAPRGHLDGAEKPADLLDLELGVSPLQFAGPAI